MTAGAEVICNDVVRKVEIESNCDVNEVGGGGGGVVVTVDDNVGGNSNGDVGGDGKDDTDDSSYVFVSDGVEMSADDPDDTGGVSVDDFVDKSASADEVDRLKKGEINEAMPVDLLVSSTVSDLDVNVENGSTVDTPVVLETNAVVQSVNGDVNQISGEEEVAVKSTEEVADVDAIQIVEIEMDDAGCGVTFDPQSTVNTIESSPVTVSESDSSIHLSDVTISQSPSTPVVINGTDESLSAPDVTCELMFHEGPESISNLIEKVECQVTLDGSGKPSEDLEGQVTADGSESSRSLTEEREDQATVDESGKPSEDLECQVTADGSESSQSSTKELEDQVTVDESGKPSEDLECQVTAGELNSSRSLTEEQGQVIVDESGMPSEDLECQVTAGVLESSQSSTEEEVQVTVDESGKPSEDLECQVTESESSRSPTEEQEGQATVDESGKPAEDLECQVVADGSESSQSSTKEGEGQVTVDESGKPSEDLATQVTADEPESLGSEIKERECEVLVDGSDSIGSLVDKQEFPVSVDAEPSCNYTVEEDEKSEEINVETEPIYACDGIKVEHQRVSVSVSCQSENSKAEGTYIGLSTDSEENLDSGLVLSEDTDALANGQAEKFDGILGMGETEISRTEADRSVLMLLDSKKERSEEKQIEGSSETLLKVTESAEIMANSEDMKEQVQIEDGIQDSQIVVTDNVQYDLNLEDNTTESANEAEVPLEAETNIEAISHVNTASIYEASNSIDKPQEAFQLEGGSETVDLVKAQGNNGELLVVKDNDSISAPDELIVVEQKTEIVAHLDTENRATEDMDCGTGVENIDVTDDDDDDEKETKVKDVPVEYEFHLVTNNRAAEGMDCGLGVENVDVSDDKEKEIEVKDASVEFVPHMVTENISAEDNDCGTGVENVDFPDYDEKETEVKDAPVGGHSTLSFSDTIVNSGAVIEFGSIGRHETTHNIQNEEAEDTDGIQSDEIPTSSAEGSVNDAINVQNEVSEVLPYTFLIKIPRFEDENFRDQIRRAQLLVDEKTRIRDAIRVEIHGKRAKLKAHNEAYNAAKMEETAARRLIRLKRQEIDSVQAVISRWKNAMSVEDIDGRIFSMEHMIQHETLLLKDEKQFIREIKQLKSLRDQLASNMGSTEDIREAIDQKDQNEERMKTLRKELDSLKDKASKAEAVVKTIEKTYNEESRGERELQARFRAADDVRQNVYAQLNNLKRQLYDKNQNFRQFKEDLVAARDFASHGNKDALYRLCANQVETFMEQWNNNDEFRKEYVSRCSMNASRRQRALDGGPLVSDDVVPVLPGNVNGNVDNSPVSIPGEVNVSVVSPVEEGKIVSSTEKNHTDNNSNNRSIENVPSQKNQTLKTKGVAKVTNLTSDDMEVVAELAVDNKKEEEKTLTEEEIELAKKAEELRNEEIAAKLKEQRRQEEKAKAIEALERKKRIAEKAQIRAELRARKEAEQKEKEREKRLRKKEKKKTGSKDGSINGEEATAASESATAAITKDAERVSKETHISKETNVKKTRPPPPHFFSKQLKPKSIPPPLVNRNKKRWLQWGKWVLAVTGIFFLFLLGNTSYIRLKFNGLI